MAINATQITFLCSTIRSLGIANEHDGENLQIYVFSCSAGNIYIFYLVDQKLIFPNGGSCHVFAPSRTCHVLACNGRYKYSRRSKLKHSGIRRGGDFHERILPHQLTIKTSQRLASMLDSNQCK